MLRFLHITDSHISADPAFLSHGHNALHHLRHLVAAINQLPYDFDFVWHTGDVVEDGSHGAYEQARSVLAGLRAPVHYLAGNHDNAMELQRTLLGSGAPRDRYDYDFNVAGVQLVALDSRGPADPGGELRPAQLAWLAQFCAPDGPPLVIALHHQPLPLDVPWLDGGETLPTAMLVSNWRQFLAVLRPARERLRGVFFGHVHRGFQVWQEGILFSSAPSCCAQLKTWPGLREPLPAPEEAPGYCLVIVEPGRTIVQQYTFARPVAASNAVASAPDRERSCGA